VQSNGIALVFHRQAQHTARQHRGIANRLERQPRFVESGCFLQNRIYEYAP
jgi:hypothetical protein